MPVSQANAAPSVFSCVLLCRHWAHEESEITRNCSMHNAEVFAVVGESRSCAIAAIRRACRNDCCTEQGNRYFAKHERRNCSGHSAELSSKKGIFGISAGEIDARRGSRTRHERR